MYNVGKAEVNYDFFQPEKLIYRLTLSVILVSIIQDLPMITWALLEGMPTSPQKYVKFDEISHFYNFKVIKYILFSITLLLVLREILKNALLEKITFIVVSAVVVVTLPSIIVWLKSSSFLLFIAGGKAWLPIGGIVCGFLLVNSFVKFEQTLYVFLILNLLIAIIQQIHGIVNFQNHEIVNLPQIEWKHLATIYRSTGMFAESNTLGLFGVSAILFAAIYERASWSFIAVCFLIIVLSGSRTAQLAALFPLLYIIQKDGISNIWKLLILVSLKTSIIYMLWMRGFQSLFERFTILLESYNTKNVLFGNGFGTGTLGSYNFMNYFKNMSVPLINTDSMFTSLQVQGGVWMNLLFWSILCLPLLIFPKQRIKLIVLLITFMLASCGLVVLEVWPFNIIWFVIYGAVIMQGLTQNDKLQTS